MINLSRDNNSRGCPQVSPTLRKWQEGAFSRVFYECYVGDLSCGQNQSIGGLYHLGADFYETAGGIFLGYGHYEDLVGD